MFRYSTQDFTKKKTRILKNLIKIKHKFIRTQFHLQRKGAMYFESVREKLR